MLSRAPVSPVAAEEAERLFAPLVDARSVLLAVSGGADSTALLWLAARWARAHADVRLAAATVDHGLRPEAAGEARAVAGLAARLGVAHRMLRLDAPLPRSRIEERARQARYAALAAEARRIGATHLVTAHTRDDQAETLLLRLAAGSGLAGLAAMRPVAPRDGLLLVRPFLDVPKRRLVATLDAEGIGWAEDAMNADPRFARVRLRQAREVLAREGLTDERLARLAARLARADAALEGAAEAALAALAPAPWREGAPIAFPRAGFLALPQEIAIRLLARAVAARGSELPADLAGIEALAAAIGEAAAGGQRLRRTLAGALVTLDRDTLAIETAPPRRAATKRPERQGSSHSS